MPERRKKRKTDTVININLVVSVAATLFIAYNTLMQMAWKDQFTRLAEQVNKIGDFVMECKVDVAKNSEKILALINRLKGKI